MINPTELNLDARAGPRRNNERGELALASASLSRTTLTRLKNNLAASASRLRSTSAILSLLRLGLFEERSHEIPRQQLFVVSDAPPQLNFQQSMHEMFRSHFPSWNRNRWKAWDEQSIRASGPGGMTLIKTCPGAGLAVGSVMIGQDSCGGGRRYGYFEVEVRGSSKVLAGIFVGAVHPQLAANCRGSKAFSNLAYFFNVGTGQLLFQLDSPDSGQSAASICKRGDRIGVLIQLEGPDGGNVSFFVNRRKVVSEHRGTHTPLTGPLVLGVQMLHPGQQLTLLPDAQPPEGMSDHFIA